MTAADLTEPARAAVTAADRTDADAEFAAFFADHWPAVAGYCAALAGGPAVGDEVAQETFTRVYVRWRRLHDPLPYAFRVATNLLKDNHRRGGLERAAVGRLRPLPDAGLHASGVDPHLLDVVRRLPPKQRDVVLLHYLADLPLAEVATAIGRPVGTVKRRLHEARALLARQLGDPDA